MIPSSLPDYLGAERSFLAWIDRPHVGDVQFVIARFGLFLRGRG
jgi:uncharacterized membrane protein YidH (DUF202 family)